MTPDGQFRTPPRRNPIATRIIAGAVLVAVAATGVALAALALWVALTLIPVILAAVLIAVLTIRFQLWRARRNAFGGRDIRRTLARRLPPAAYRSAAAPPGRRRWSARPLQ